MNDSPTASTSSTLYDPPLATLLPPEILSHIFALARPFIPPVSLERKDPPATWLAFVRFSLVHSSWTGVAQRELARCVLVRTESQRRKLGEALEKGWVVAGQVKELVFDVKETSAGRASDALGDDEQEGRDSSTLSVLLAHCGPHLEILRLRGFGDPDFLLPSFSSYSAPHLPSLHTLEYSPIDASASPTTAALFAWLSSLPTLRTLIVSPSAKPFVIFDGVHAVVTVNGIPPVLYSGTGATVRGSPPSSPPTVSLPAVQDDNNRDVDGADGSTSPPSDDDANDESPSTHLGASLQSLTLSSLVLTSPTLFTLLAISFNTLTSLTLTSVPVLGPSSLLLFILRALAPQLHHLQWEDRSVGFTALAHAMGVREGLTHEEWWSVIKACGEKMRTLKLFHEHVFHEVQGVEWALPEGLEELGIGVRGEVGVEELRWWMEKVLQLLRRGEGAEEVEEQSAKVEKGVEEERIEDVSTSESLPTASATPTAPTKRSKKPWKGSFSLAPPSSTLPSTLDQDVSTPRPPTLRHLSLWTMESSPHLREDEGVRAAIEEVVERGVAVTWWEVYLVHMDAMELTRELRREMLEVAPKGEGE